MKINKKFRALLTGLFVASVAFVVASQSTVSAYTLISGTGYFTGTSQSADGDSYAYDVIAARQYGYNAIPSSVYSGVSSSQLKSNFINWLNGYVAQNSTANTHNEVGGAFIVNAMLGRASGSRTLYISTAMWNDLVARISQSGITASWVTVDPNSLSGTTSFNNYNVGKSGGDVFFHYWNAVPRPVIEFRNSAGTLVFAIEIPCGNPLGGFPGLPQVPPATLDGYKMSNTGSTSGFEYSGLPVSVSGVTTTTGNPFYFSGGSAITMSGSLSTTQTVSVNTTNLTKGWAVIGHSICDGTADPTGCTNANLSYGAKYYVSSSASSFSYVFKSGHQYHMRWFFKSLVVLSCANFTTNPTELDPFTAFTAIAKVNLGTTAAVPANQNIALILKNSAGVTKYGPVNVVPTTSSGTSTSTYSPVGPLPGETYSVTWVYTATGYSITCNSSLVVAYMPFLAVYGGDMIAGNSPQVDAAGNAAGCYSNNSAGIYSWNTGSPAYMGAGASYAVMALGQIQDFASALGNSAPDRLAFANTTAKHNVASGLFGGDAGSVPASCDFTTNQAVTDTGNTIINGHVVGVSSTKTEDRYVKGGDVSITGDIVYNGIGGWAKLADIPSFKLVVVGGDIYINASVHELDGIYVAIPDSTGKGGHIYTCASGFTPMLTSSATYYSDCNRPLVINGSFTAKQVQFLRTFGSLRQPGNISAETFNYGPEVWLPRNTTSTRQSYNSITGLPPVL